MSWILMFWVGRILCIVIQSSDNVGICETSANFMVQVKKVAMQQKEIFLHLVIYFSSQQGLRQFLKFVRGEE